MDPNLFHLDWERTFEVLATIVVLSIILERALALLFEHRLWVKKFESTGLKELVALGVAFLVCWRWNFDSISMILLNEHTTRVGEAITAGIIAGGAKGSVRLFRDVLGFKSTAYEHYEKERRAELGLAPIKETNP